MAKYPYLSLYTGDWLKDPELSKCSATARGVWADMLCAMHESGREGKLTGTHDQLCRIARCTLKELRASLREFSLTKCANVAESNGTVTVINRRMQREHRERVKTKNRVRKYRGNGPVSDLKRQCNNDSSSSESTSKRDDDDFNARVVDLPANYLGIGLRLLTDKGATESGAKKVLLGFCDQFGGPALADAITKTSQASADKPAAYMAKILQNEANKAAKKSAKKEPNGTDKQNHPASNSVTRDYSKFDNLDFGIKKPGRGTGDNS